MSEHETFMLEALNEAQKARDIDEVPIGCVIVKNSKIISRGHNIRNSSKNPLCHAEIIAINNAAKIIGDWRLENCNLYVTLEPCPMCAGAIIQARLKKIYIGTMDEKTGACGSVLNLLEDYKFNHTVEVERGILKQECETMLKEFFVRLREYKKSIRNEIT